MAKDTWRRKAQSVIYPALRQGLAKGLEGRALRRFINTKYKDYDPLNIKRFFPYEVWREELNAAMNGEALTPQLTLDLKHG